MHIKHLSSFLGGIMLLHALIANPLLVDCIQADGRHVLEILGYDPCHGAPRAVQADAASPDGRAGTAGIADQTDPCLDLILNDQASTSILTDSFPLPPQAVARPLDFGCPGCGAMTAAGFNHPDSGSGVPFDPGLHFMLSLRI